jgi:glycosyltransferase involved in cell wall biosynthesis
VKNVFVLPAYNESATIRAVVESLKSLGTVIVVDDCSNDGTAEIAEQAGAIIVRHQYNKGYDGALNSGFEKAAALDAEFVFTFDADGQHGVDALKAAMALFEDHGDLELAVGQRPQAARLGEVIYSLYTRIRFGIGDILCGLKGYRMTLYRRHGAFDTKQMIGTELTLASISRGAKWATFEVPIAPRQDAPRFGSVIRANKRILRALASAVWMDTSGQWRSETTLS